jgi:hypothetical protein
MDGSWLHSRNIGLSSAGGRLVCDSGGILVLRLKSQSPCFARATDGGDRDGTRRPAARWQEQFADGPAVTERNWTPNLAPSHSHWH